MTAKFYGFERSFLHDTTEEDSWVIDMVRASEYVKLESEVVALQDQVRSLAAENCIQDFVISAVKGLVRESEGVAGWHLNGDIATWEEVLPEIDHSETPATDSALREIRAQGVEALRDSISNIDKGIENTIDLHHYCTDFAASIRTGEQP